MRRKDYILLAENLHDGLRRAKPRRDYPIYGQGYLDACGDVADALAKDSITAADVAAEVRKREGVAKIFSQTP